MSVIGFGGNDIVCYASLAHVVKAVSGTANNVNFVRDWTAKTSIGSLALPLRTGESAAQQCLTSELGVIWLSEEPE